MRTFGEVAERKGEVENLIDDFAELNDQSENLIDDFAELNDQSEILIDDFAELNDQSENLVDDFAELNNQSEILIDDFAELNNQSEILIDDFAELNNQSENLIDHFAELKDPVENLVVEFADHPGQAAKHVGRVEEAAEKCVRGRMESEDTMRTKVYWIREDWAGQLGILPRPRGGDWLRDEAAAWREAGIDMVVSLLEPEETAQLILEEEAAAAASNGIAFRAFPIPDRSVPASREAVADLAIEILHALKTGKHVAIHCRQGIGRSGLIAGGVLVAAGMDPVTALETVAMARGLEVPETEEQRQWLMDFAAWFASKKAVAVGRVEEPALRLS